MIIFPAIDLYKGEAVRLTKGDYSQMTVYGKDPVKVARGFMDSGATVLHVVDLEGARDGVPRNFDIIERITAESGLDVQIGGGIRSAVVVEKYLSIGVGRVILGTAAVGAPGFITDMVANFGGAVAIAVDIKDRRVATQGWTDVSEHDALDFCRAAEELGVKTLICTDISKDGMLSGTNIELYRTLRKMLSTKLIASGGVTSTDDVKALAALGMDGAIIGRAIYTGDIDLAEAIAAASPGNAGD